MRVYMCVFIRGRNALDRAFSGRSPDRFDIIHVDKLRFMSDFVAVMGYLDVAIFRRYSTRSGLEFVCDFVR